MKKKAALFGDCFVNGTCSHYIVGENRKIKGKCGLGLKERSLKLSPSKYSINENLNNYYNLIDFSESMSSTAYIGGKSLESSILYKFQNNNLEDIDIIIIQCGMGDYRKTQRYAQQTILGEYDSVDPNTILGAFNIIIKELKTKYIGKQVIFILPPYGNCKHLGITFEEYLGLLKQKFEEAEYPYISPYDFLMSIKPNKLDIRYLFPDNCHMTMNMMFLTTDYIIEEIVRIIK